MPAIYLVRHGQDEDNVRGILNGHRDQPLTELGRQQAGVVADKLRPAGIEVIVASSLRRAFDTAHIIATTLGVADVLKHDALIERDFGVLTGKPITAIDDYATDFLQTDKVKYFLDAEGAEDFPTTYARARRVLGWVTAQYADRTVLLVTHGDIGKMIRAAYHGWTWQDGLRTPYLDNTGILELAGQSDIAS